jgi:hypothetical protein
VQNQKVEATLGGQRISQVVGVYRKNVVTAIKKCIKVALDRIIKGKRFIVD